MIGLDVEKRANEFADIPTVDLPASTSDHYYSVANLIMKLVKAILDPFHLSHNEEVFIFVYAVLVFLISFGLGLILQWIVVKVVNRLSKHWKSDIYNNLIGDKFFTRVCRIIPALFFLIFIQFTLASHTDLSEWLTKLTWCYIIILFAIALCSLVDVTWTHIDNRENKRKLPLRGIVSLTKGIIVIIAIIIIIALLLDRSPASLLAGLGAFAAILMLVFKDSILGVVAGVQLSENDSLHVGDWIKVGDANGFVQEVTLTQVKVLNWDKTVTTVPPYSLVSGGFTNLRPMQDSGTRRVERSYLIDADSVKQTTEDMLDDFEKIPLISDWVKKKRAQRAAGKVENVFNSEGLADGSIETNLGVLRGYLNLYLKNHPNVDKDADGKSLTFVCTLPQTSAGIPLQLYFFTTTAHWQQYEGISADIFEHIAVILKAFKLYTFEYPSGRDTLIEGYLNPGNTPDSVFGLPEGIFHPKAPEGDVPGSQAPPVVQNPDTDSIV